MYSDASAGETSIETAWDAVTSAGWMIVPGHNGGQRACWDGALKDATCS